jgi:hypothetical protein
MNTYHVAYKRIAASAMIHQDHIRAATFQDVVKIIENFCPVDGCGKTLGEIFYIIKIDDI